MVLSVFMAAKKRNRAITVGFVALGCPKNVVDSEKMLAEIGQAGFVITADVDNADVVVINTCAFIAPAKAEAVEAIGRAVACKNRGKVKKVIVAGCLPERLGEELLSEITGVDAIVGLGSRDRIAAIIKQTLGGGNDRVYLPGSAGEVHDDRGRLLLTPRHWAYLRISEGCNRRCSFCTIPVIRGAFRSKPAPLVLAEATELVANGAVELNIIAQDSSYYGRDLKEADGLSKLVRELEKIEGLRWVRLMYLYPAGIDNELIETVAGSEKVVKYVDMPVQHINNEILRAMRRADRKEKTVRLIEALRMVMPEVVLRTTVMVGFPGESEEQFNELLEFVRRAEFDALGCFRFYAELGTAAAGMPNQVPEQVKQRRFDELMVAQQEIVFAKNKRQIGRELLCLVDSVDEQACGVGRYYGQAPDIDGVCTIRNCSHRAGEFARVKIVAADGYDFVVEEI